MADPKETKSNIKSDSKGNAKPNVKSDAVSVPVEIKVDVKPDAKGETKLQPEVKPADAKEDKKMAALLKEIDQAFFTIRFYPVAVKEPAKKEAIETLKKIYQKGEEHVKQLILFQFHEHLSKSEELKAMHNFDFFKRMQPNGDPAQIRIQVYRTMFNYHFSLEGLIELLHIVSSLDGDDSAKLITYHLSFYSAIETEATHMLRNAAIDALGASSSPYALRSLLQYVRYTDSENFIHRILDALARWDKKLDHLSLPASEKKQLREEISKMLTIEVKETHYG